ncbi:hypothetical protein AAFF_G00139150 [Aldrovandia affinis]|uniref:Protein-serine/threonine phosphatase n=1 Tax=Aldrovandia affinis TaxID=143900 RepID=A0AAD7TDI7_9TELE|nr:hypothetical protein AAFF_G00139150 [Aldrovandia affinis]
MTTAQDNRHDCLAVKELENILDTCKLELTPVDEVWPNLYIGNVAIAQSRTALQKMGITHILNAAHSKQGSIGDQNFYGNMFVYSGIPAEDSPQFDLSIYFKPAAEFIHKALKKTDSKVLVHCIMGLSRSSTLVLAYLMLHHRLNLHSAIQMVIQKRAIYPNRNFLTLLLDLDGLRKNRHDFEGERGSGERGMALNNSHRDKEEYQTPSVPELQLLLLENICPRGPVNQVWPNLYIGNAATARDRSTLFNMRITHIVNAAHGPYHINTGARFYRDMTIDYYGVEADDAEDFNLSLFFHPIAKFIRAALLQRGKVFVHCAMGVSRSATLVLAFLMICENLTLVEAINAVRQHRDICPNAGFLSQLRGKVLVHCGMGISRAPTIVFAFLMIWENLTLVEAINTVEQHRHVFPNEGFLDQLRHLDMTLALQRRRKKES